MRISDWSSDVCSSDLAGDRAQRVETASDGGDEARLRLHVGRHRPEQRRLLLVGAVGPPEPLDRAVGLPASLQQIMDTQPLVPRAEIGLVAAARAARVREDQHALGIGLERLGLAEIGRAWSVLDALALAPVGTALSSVPLPASRPLF